MKVNPKQYAILLYELTKDAKKRGLEERTRDFLNLLLKNRALGQLPKILLFYGQYYNARENVVDVEMVTAREVERKIKNGIETIEPSPLPAQAGQPSPHGRGGLTRTNVRYSIDSTVLGGARIRIGDYMVDDTLKARLRALRNSL